MFLFSQSILYIFYTWLYWSIKSSKAEWHKSLTACYELVNSCKHQASRANQSVWIHSDEDGELVDQMGQGFR